MTPDEEMLVRYAKIIKNYCKEGYQKHKCSGCTFERYSRCLLYIHNNTKITHDKEEQSEDVMYVEPDNKRTIMIQKFITKLRENCNSLIHTKYCHKNCIFNKDSKCKLTSYPAEWKI